MEELSAKLNTMADLDDELKQVKTKHEMTAKQNADMFIKLQVHTQQLHHNLDCPATVCTGVVSAHVGPTDLHVQGVLTWYIKSQTLQAYFVSAPAGMKA